MPTRRCFPCRPMLCLALLQLVALAGCGGNEFDLAPVSGRITLDGKPLPGADVVFQPFESNAGTVNVGPGSFGHTDEQGNFTLKTMEGEAGAVVGKHHVTVTLPKEEADAQAALDNDEITKVISILPDKYRNGEAEFVVPSGGTQEAEIKIPAK